MYHTNQRIDRVYEFEGCVIIMWLTCTTLHVADGSLIAEHLSFGDHSLMIKYSRWLLIPCTITKYIQTAVHNTPFTSTSPRFTRSHSVQQRMHTHRVCDVFERLRCYQRQCLNFSHTALIPNTKSGKVIIRWSTERTRVHFYVWKYSITPLHSQLQGYVGWFYEMAQY